MRIKKLIISFGIIFLIVFAICIIVSNSRYIWKLFGYTFCEEVENIQIFSVLKDQNTQSVVIKGKVESEEGYYTGYSFHIVEEKLYIGIKYNKYFGYENKAKDFTIQIPCQLNKIKSIYLIDGGSLRKIL